MELPELLPQVEKNVVLAPLTTFKIGGPAQYLFEAKTTEDIKEAIGAATKIGMPFFILAGGSNILVSDEGFKGLVIVIKNTDWSIDGMKVHAGAGVSVSTLVTETGKRGLSGLEWAGGLPGSVGGAIRGNAGAFGGETKDNLIEVEILDENNKVRMISNKECEFGYRTSVFKKKNWIILSATFKLKEGDTEEIKNVAAKNIEYREKRHPLEYANAGSMFKNCDVKNIPSEIQEQFKDVIKVDPFSVLPTAALIDAAGLKGMKEGQAQVSEKHPNYIVNLRGATAKDVLSLVKKVKTVIKDKYGVELQEEVQYIA